MRRLSSRVAFLVCIGLTLAAKLHASEMRWNLNDVSYLFPIPRGQNQSPDSLLTPDDAGRRGVLVPDAIRNDIPTLLNDGTGNQSLFLQQHIRAVSMRVDPCPRLDRNACAPEVRLVWQPVQFDRFDGRWTARDAAIHSIYALPLAEFEQLTGELWRLKAANVQAGVTTDKRPLGVHPALSDPRTAMAFHQRLRRIILDHCGERNLVRVSFMSLMIPTQWWRFGSFQRDDKGEWRRLAIPRVGVPDEDVFNVAQEKGTAKGNPGVEMDAVFNVLPDEYPERDNLFVLINQSGRQESAGDRSVIRDKLEAIARFTNPHQTNFHTLDCAACHYADASRFYAERLFPALKKHVSGDAYRNPDPGLFDLSNTTIGQDATRILRGFGYFEDQPSLNQRTINESAESAHRLNTHP